MKKRKAADVDLLFPDPQQKPSKKKKTCKVTPDSPPAKPIGDRQNDILAPPVSQAKWDKQNVKIINPAGNIPANKEKKRKFFDEMIKEASETNVGHVTGGSEKRGPIASSDSEDDVKITGMEEKSSYVFNPLTLQQQTVICERTSLEMYKKQLNHTNVGERMLARPPKVRSVKGDGNCFFRAMVISITGWEVGHLKIHQLVCDYIKSFGPHTHECEGKLYLNQTKMKTSTTYATDVEIMAGAQICGVDIYFYHTYGKGLRWLKFPCKHQSGTPSTNAIYLDNRYGNGKTGHFNFVTGLFNYNLSLHCAASIC